MAAADRGFAILAISVVVLLFASIAFAALALLVRVRNDRAEALHHRLVARWEPAMLEVLEGAAPDAALLGQVDPRDASIFVGFLLEYSRRLRGEERATVRRLADPYLPALAASIGRGSSERRGLAVHRLAEIGMPEYAGTVAGALEDRSPLVAMIAGRGLFRPGQEKYFPAVLAQVPRLANLSRSFLASLLARGGPGAAPLLREILANPGQPPLVRAVAADALTHLNDLPSVPVAVGLLGSITDRELVAACLRLLRHLGHHDHVACVRPFVKSPDPLVAAAATGALAAIGGPGDVTLLQEALAHEDYWVSLQAARGLVALGQVDALRRLAASTGPWAVLAQQVMSE
jgi:hypothetical protein